MGQGASLPLIRLEPVGEALSELRHLGRDDHAAVPLLRVPVVVTLVVIFRRIEDFNRLELSDQWRIPHLAEVDFRDELLSCHLLFFTMVENYRPVLRADIGTLPV